jgi:hypothetical protein
MYPTSFEICYVDQGHLSIKQVMALTQEEAEKKSGIPEQDIRSVYEVAQKKTTHYTYGQLDPVQLFCLPVWIQEFIKKYPAHPSERAFAKGIPVTAENMSVIKRIAQVIPLIRRWRGSSRFLGEIGKSQYYNRPHAYCQKEGAERVSLYYRERI